MPHYLWFAHWWHLWDLKVLALCADVLLWWHLWDHNWPFALNCNNLQDKWYWRNLLLWFAECELWYIEFFPLEHTFDVPKFITKRQYLGQYCDLGEPSVSLFTFRLLHPDCTRIAKSPISCGTSCSKIVMVVMMPNWRLTRKDAPMARPSVKLWVQSAARFR